MDNLYRENILDHYRNPRNFGRLKTPNVSYEEYNPFCGDRIGMEIKFKIQSANWRTKFEIEDIRFYGEGCAISIASASLLTQKAKNMDLKKINKLVSSNILELLGIELTPTRLKCALLPLEVLQKALTLAKET